jgi:hypothetical protein
MQIVPYLVGGLTAFLVMDIAPIPSPTEQLGALRASMSAPTLGLGTQASSINRAAKGDRGAMPRPAPAAAPIAPVESVSLRDANMTIMTKGLRQHSGNAVKPVPLDVLHDQQARDRKPPASRERKVPIGCEPSFSPVAAPSLAHHTGRCVAHLQRPWALHG